MPILFTKKTVSREPGKPDADVSPSYSVAITAIAPHVTKKMPASIRKEPEPSPLVIRNPRIAVLCYPLFSQNQGGLEIQVNKTIAHLQNMGTDIRLIDPYREKLKDFDLIHVFSASHGNFRMIDHARSIGRPVILSPLIRAHWNRGLAKRAAAVDRLMGYVTHWEMSTEYRQLHTALTGADFLIALGAGEKRAMIDVFDVPEQRIAVVPNGIPSHFFEGSPESFASHFGIEPGFVLNVGNISEHKNQVGMAAALAETGLRMVFVGPCQPANRPYLDKLLAVPNTTYLGPLPYDSPLLASAYAAAGVFCLPSRSEVMPLSVMEALASGTPAVLTCHHGMDRNMINKDLILEVDPLSPQRIRQAVLQLHNEPPSEMRCRDAVRHLTWDAVARQVYDLYTKVLQNKPR